jgi:hypothetical protein
MGVVDGSFGHPMKIEEEASAPLAGGMMNHGFQCGMLWGASLAAGAEAYGVLGRDRRLKLQLSWPQKGWWKHSGGALKMK